MLTKGASSAFRDMELSDRDSDNVWRVYLEGRFVREVPVNFDSGVIVVNGERSNDSDSAYADFKNLEFQVKDRSSWPAWTDPQEAMDTDPGYHWNRVADDHVQVLHD